MPQSIIGLDETLKALRTLDSDIYKEMNKDIRVALKDLQSTARAIVPDEIPGLRTGWLGKGFGKSRTSKERGFPKYDASAARKGIVYSMGRRKANPWGWASVYALLNKSATGAILETAGRASGYGQGKKSRSNNPDAGVHFVNAIASSTGVGPLYRVGQGASTRGRIIYRAVAQDNGATKARIIHAINAATDKFIKNTKIGQAGMAAYERSIAA